MSLASRNTLKILSSLSALLPYGSKISLEDKKERRMKLDS
jgi:hypothetical protein